MTNSNFDKSIQDAAEQAWQWLESASQCSLTDAAKGEGVTRFFATAEHAAVLSKLTNWMESLDMDVRRDAVVNLIGRYRSDNPAAKTLIIGSHQDTVKSGGKYDGMMGVICGLALVHALRSLQIQLPFHIDVVAFGDEEGSRFQTSLFSSQALAGTFDTSILTTKDDNGVSLADALTAFGGNMSAIETAAYNRNEVLGYIEAHIEQGPVLEEKGVPVGIVSAITGIERHQVTITGKAGHAGTVPMHLRKDALVGAAYVIQAVDNICQQTDELVGVVGKINNFPNGSNVIPGKVVLTLELRSPKDKIRLTARQQLFKSLEDYFASSELQMEHEQIYQEPATDCDAELSQHLATAIRNSGVTETWLFSGAGHDGLSMRDLCPIAMLFVRCKDGVSHRPDEAISEEDLAVSLGVLVRFCLNTAGISYEPNNN